MSIIHDIGRDYFDWLCEIVCENRYSAQISYSKLLAYLHDTEFRYLHPMDKNRAARGANLRYTFALCHVPIEDTAGITNALAGPCSVLEMMVALAIDCEETIMTDPCLGDRTGQWFWDMVVSLGLGSAYDDRFDEYYVEDVIERFLNREYEPDGRGGLFTVRHCDCDLRDIEIWWQACRYLNSII